jgi:hypothetical protein
MEPFNLFFYKDCFYNSLFSVINKFSGSVWNVLAHEAVFYDYSEDKVLRGKINYYSETPLFAVLADMNISNMTSYSTDFLIDTIRKAIVNETPVIVKVDCYEEDIRKDFYHKEHLDHSLLIYGYDDIEEKFNIIEQSQKNILNYSPVVISYESLKNAADCYVRHYHSQFPEEALLTGFMSGLSDNKGTTDEFSYMNYRLYYLRSLDRMLKQADPLEVIVNELINYLSGYRELENDIDNVIEELNEIVNARTVEKYKVDYFLRNEEMTALADTILSNWLSIRLALLNYKFRGNNIRDKFEKTIRRLRENQMLEQRLNYSVFVLLANHKDLT